MKKLLKVVMAAVMVVVLLYVGFRNGQRYEIENFVLQCRDSARTLKGCEITAANMLRAARNAESELKECEEKLEKK